MNLLKETQDFIKDTEHNVEDIIFIGDHYSGHSCTWDEFLVIAKELEYDSGYGSAEIAVDLTIVFIDGGMMTRWEYDGSEGWKYRRPFVRPKKELPITRLSSTYGYTTVAEINEPKG